VALANTTANALPTPSMLANAQYVPDSTENLEYTASASTPSGRDSFSPEGSPTKGRGFFTPEGSPIKNKGYFTPETSPTKDNKGYFTPEGSPVKSLNPYYPDSYLASTYVPGSLTKDIASRNENSNKNSTASTENVSENPRNSKRSLSVVSVLSEGYESGNDTRSRVDSISSAVSDLKIDAQDDGEFVDYKALYEAAKAENDKLKTLLKAKDDDLQATKATLERLSASAARNSLSEQDKREKRAMERKISEMEEELKLLQNYKQENQRLKAENRALTRVVSKLTTSAQNQLHSKQ
jgi:Skp family chaperone for outer membrane proteins